MVVETEQLSAALSGLDALDVVAAPAGRLRRARAVILPKVAATIVFIGLWQLLVASKWKPEYVVPSPFSVLHWMGQNPGSLLSASWVTLSRGLLGFAIADRKSVV